MSTLLPGTQVEARWLPWEVVHAEPAGEQQRLRLRCLQGDLRGMELDLLHPFEAVRIITTDLNPRCAGRLRQWRLYHDAFLLEQALGPSALLTVQPGRLDIAPYQLVPVMRALRMSRPRRQSITAPEISPSRGRSTSLQGAVFLHTVNRSFTLLCATIQETHA